MKRFLSVIALGACLAVCGGCVTGAAGGSAGDDSTTRKARSLLADIFKVDGKLFGTASLSDLAPLLNAAGQAYDVPGAGDTVVKWDDRLLEALGRKVDDAKASGADPFAGVASVDGPWLDAAGAPVKFPLQRERVKRIVETFGGAAVPSVPAVPTPPVVTPPPAPPPAPPATDPIPPRPAVPGIDG